MVILLGLLLIISLCIHSISLFFLVKSKSLKYLKLFFITAFFNVTLSIILSIIIINTKHIGSSINFEIVKLVFSGLIFFSTLIIKILIFRRVYIRAQDPKHYHLNFFGKKVLHPSVIKGAELLLFFATMPIFLLSGAYFIAKLVDQM